MHLLKGPRKTGAPRLLLLARWVVRAAPFALRKGPRKTGAPRLLLLARWVVRAAPLRSRKARAKRVRRGFCSSLDGWYAPPLCAPERPAQNGCAAAFAPGSMGGTRRPLCAPERPAQNGCAAAFAPGSMGGTRRPLCAPERPAQNGSRRGFCSWLDGWYAPPPLRSGGDRAKRSPGACRASAAAALTFVSLKL